jgi:Uncharacterised nucleotidyltransferase
LDRSSCPDHASGRHWPWAGRPLGAHAACRHRCASRFAGSQVRSTRLLGLCAQISEALHRAGIAHAFLKGRLTARWWRDASYRPQTDVDLLVRPVEARHARHCLAKQLGTSPADVSGDHQFHDTLQSAMGPIEVHVGLSADFRLQTSPEALLRRSVVHTCEQVSLTGLALEDELVHLAMHAATHGPGRLLWLYDLREIAERVPQSTWNVVAERAAEWNAISSVWWGLLLAACRLGAQIELAPMERLIPATIKSLILRQLALADWFANSHQHSMRWMRLALADDGMARALGRGAYRSLRRRRLSPEV